MKAPDKVRTYYLVTSINDDGSIHMEHKFKVQSQVLPFYSMLKLESDSAYEQTKDFPKDLQVFYTVKLEHITELTYGSGTNKKVERHAQMLANNLRNK